MKYINQCFLTQELSYNGNGYLPLVEWTVSEIIKNNSNLNIESTELFWLFSYIKDNFRSTLAQFYNYDIENDILGFPAAQRAIRHSIESFLDLNNLVISFKYKKVLEYCSNSNKKNRNEIDLDDYKSALYNNGFTIQSKYKISKLDEEGMMQMAKEANSYTHPDVYLDINKIRENQEILLKNLITMNINLLNKSFFVFMKGIESLGADTSLLKGNIYIYNENIIVPYKYKYEEKLKSTFQFVNKRLMVNCNDWQTNNYSISQ